MVSPIDLQTVVGQMQTAGRVQQAQQTAAMDLQSSQMIKDARRLRELDEQVEDTRATDGVEETKDATKRQGGGGGAASGRQEEDREEGGEPPTAGRFIDVEG